MLLRVATGVVLSALVAVLVLVVPARSGPAASSDDSAINLVADPSTASGRVEAELLVLRSDGFKPNEITRLPGRFLLAIQNHSSAEEISLVLKQESGASMRQVHMAKRQSKLKETLELSPGRYVLTEGNHPEWTCTIVITPNN